MILRFNLRIVLQNLYQRMNWVNCNLLSKDLKGFILIQIWKLSLSLALSMISQLKMVFTCRAIINSIFCHQLLLFVLKLSQKSNRLLCTCHKFLGKKGWFPNIFVFLKDRWEIISWIRKNDIYFNIDISWNIKEIECNNLNVCVFKVFRKDFCSFPRLRSRNLTDPLLPKPQYWSSWTYL